MSEPLTHQALVALAERHLRGTRKCSIVLTERGSFEIVDAIGWTYFGDSIMVECKTSRADYLADGKKLRCFDRETGVGRERWYLMPPGLIKPEELRPGWGLLEVRGQRVYRIVKAPARTGHDLRAE